MNLEGQMVKAGGIPARVVLEYADYARVVWVDAHGCIRYRWHYRNELIPMSVVLSARTHWPESGDLDMREAEREEQAAAAAREIERGKARKARRSNKLKRAAA